MTDLAFSWTDFLIFNRTYGNVQNVQIWSEIVDIVTRPSSRQVPLLNLTVNIMKIGLRKQPEQGTPNFGIDIISVRNLYTKHCKCAVIGFQYNSVHLSKTQYTYSLEKYLYFNVGKYKTLLKLLTSAKSCINSLECSTGYWNGNNCKFRTYLGITQCLIDKLALSRDRGHWNNCVN